MIPGCLNTMTSLTPGQRIELGRAPRNLGDAKNRVEELQMTSSKHTHQETQVLDKIKQRAV
jgi:hypothetical protein